MADNSLVTSTILNSIVLAHTHQLNGCLVWLVTSNLQLPYIHDNLYCALSGFASILSVVGPVVTLLQGSFMYLASAEEILLICKLAM